MLSVRPIPRDQALQFISQHHRTHGRPQGYRFAIAAVKDEVRICGVAIAGRPVARRLDDGVTLEVIRCCTDGTKNACSFLYGAVRRIGREMGYRRFVTYTLPEEGGASLRAAGWSLVAETQGGSWDRDKRPRVDTHPTQRKFRWEAE